MKFIINTLGCKVNTYESNVMRDLLLNAGYKEAQEKALPKFKYYALMMADLRKTLDEEIKPLLS